MDLQLDLSAALSKVVSRLAVAHVAVSLPDTVQVKVKMQYNLNTLIAIINKVKGKLLLCCRLQWYNWMF